MREREIFEGRRKGGRERGGGRKRGSERETKGAGELGGKIYHNLFLQWHTVDTRGWIEVVSCSYLCHSSLFTLRVPLLSHTLTKTNRSSLPFPRWTAPLSSLSSLLHLTMTALHSLLK